jgi:hypothetical protein
MGTANNNKGLMYFWSISFEILKNSSLRFKKKQNTPKGKPPKKKKNGKKGWLQLKNLMESIICLSSINHIMTYITYNEKIIIIIKKFKLYIYIY